MFPNEGENIILLDWGRIGVRIFNKSCFAIMTNHMPKIVQVYFQIKIYTNSFHVGIITTLAFLACCWLMSKKSELEHFTLCFHKFSSGTNISPTLARKTKFPTKSRQRDLFKIISLKVNNHHAIASSQMRIHDTRGNWQVTLDSRHESFLLNYSFRRSNFVKMVNVTGRFTI